MSARDSAPAPADAVPLKPVLLLAGFGLLAGTLSACESTEQESARIAREGQRLVSATSTLSLGAVDRQVRVSEATIVSGGGRTAVAVRLTNTARTPKADVPVLVQVTGARSKLLYTNNTAGLEASLQHAPLLEPGRPQWWVDDQVLTTRSATGVKVKVGSGSRPHRVAGAPAITGVRQSAQDGQAVVSGTLASRSTSAQEKVPVFAVALRDGRVVAAGRAVIEALPARGSEGFEIFLVGNPAGASLQLSAAPAAG